MNNKFNPIAIHILPGCSTYIRKVLIEDEWYLFNGKYKEVNGKLLINDSYSVPENFYSNKINIQAIVGKNGSGKSSVIEVILRLINNLAYLLISEVHTDTNLYFVNELNAEFFYEIDERINSLKCDNNKVYLNQGNGYISVGSYLDVKDELFHDSIGQGVLLKEAIPLLQKFFFTIVNNYSFHAYNASDFQEEFEDREHVWLNGVFHKNDGYLTPLVLNPYRNLGKIDMEGEKKLTNIRLASLFYLFKKEGIALIPEYEFHFLIFNLDTSYVRDKYIIQEGHSAEKKEIQVNINNTKKDIFNCTLKCYFDTIIEDDRLEHAYKYLVYKTFSISSKYPNYHSYFKAAPTTFNLDCSESNKSEIKELVNKIKSDTSHTTIKIRQTLKYIDFIKSNIGTLVTEEREYQYFQTIEQEYIDYRPKDTSIFNKLTDIDTLIANFPPPFYKITITLKTTKDEDVTFDKMSSGERQFLFYISTLIYHLKNLDSVINGDESVHYKYVNIVLEEVELYFHPEYQRQFISKLIHYIEACHFDKLEYFNFIIATHSPFILSDIPHDNIMFLDKGKQVNVKNLTTFGANIHDMLRNSFFMENGLIGDFAKSQIKRVLCFLDNKCDQSPCTQTEIKQVIEMIGEPLIRDRLLSMFNVKFGVDEVEQLKVRIKELESQVNKPKQ